MPAVANAWVNAVGQWNLWFHYVCVCTSMLWKKNNLNYQHQTWYTYTSCQDLIDSEVKRSKVKGTRLRSVCWSRCACCYDCLGFQFFQLHAQSRKHPSTKPGLASFPFIVKGYQCKVSVWLDGLLMPTSIITHGTSSLAICHRSGCTVASGTVGVIVCICNRSQMRTSNPCLIFSVSKGLDPG